MGKGPYRISDKVHSSPISDILPYFSLSVVFLFTVCLILHSETETGFAPSGETDPIIHASPSILLT